MYSAPDLVSIDVTEPADIINLVLLLIYGFPSSELTPSLDTVEATLDALIKYGMSIQTLAAPYLPLYQAVFSHAPFRPIEAYALAAHYKLEELAVAVSSHLLSYDTSQLSDELSLKMGPVYLKRLLDLHRTRLASLKTIVLTPPARHAPIRTCDDAAQKELTTLWAYAAAELVWEASPGMDPVSRETTLILLIFLPRQACRRSY